MLLHSSKKLVTTLPREQVKPLSCKTLSFPDFVDAWYKNSCSSQPRDEIVIAKRSVTLLRCGNIKATAWQNGSEKGPFFATTFSRPFKDHSGACRSSTEWY